MFDNHLIIFLNVRENMNTEDSKQHILNYAKYCPNSAASLMVPGCSMIWLAQFLKIHEAMNRGTVSQGCSCWRHFLQFCREHLVTKEPVALWIAL